MNGVGMKWAGTELLDEVRSFPATLLDDVVGKVQERDFALGRCAQGFLPPRSHKVRCVLVVEDHPAPPVYAMRQRRLLWDPAPPRQRLWTGEQAQAR